MQVVTARTCETFDIEHLCQDLQVQIAEHAHFGSRTIGIAICDSTLDYCAVMKRLSEIYSFDIYGTTALAFIGIQSNEEISVSFTVMTGDEELVSAIVLSEPWTMENKERVIRDAYVRGREQLGEAPTLLMILQPFSTEITADTTTRILDEASNHCPIYGAVSSADLSTPVSGIFVNGEFYPDRILIHMLGGEIRPQFAIAQVKLPASEKRVVITQARGNMVYRVGEDTFLQFMAKNGLIIEPSHVLDSFIASYTHSPVIVYGVENGRAVEWVRHIVDIDYENDAVVFSGEMPEGREAAIAVISREDVIRSTRECLAEMIAKTEVNAADRNSYNALFVTSCGSRYLIMTADASVEGNYITSHPAMCGLAMCGFYAMGEICPTAVDEHGKADNHAHHSSIALMAL